MFDDLKDFPEGDVLGYAVPLPEEQFNGLDERFLTLWMEGF